MEKADEILRSSKYTKATSERQHEDAQNAFEPSEVPEWYLNGNEPTPESGRNKV